MHHLESFSIAGKALVVTGASKGIGQGVAMILAKMGARVALVARNQVLLEETAAKIKADGGESWVFPADLRDIDSIYHCVDRIIETFGKIDILFNNAGMGNPIPALEIKEADWDDMMDLNLKGVFFFSQAVAKYMVKNKYGKIIHMSSQASVVALKEEAIYCASKGGINQLTKVLAAEWAEYGINVNAIGPTFVRTPGTAERLDNPAVYQSVIDHIPLRRVASVEDVANAVLYLATPSSDMVTGVLLLIDGGWTIL